MRWKDAGIEVAAKRGIPGPNIEVNLHASARVFRKGERRGARFSPNLGAIHQPNNRFRRPLEGIGMKRAAQVQLECVLLAVIGAWVSVDGVRLHLAIRADLLEIELVPECARFFGAVFPKEKRAHDPITGRKAGARFEAPVAVGLGAVQLRASHGQAKLWTEDGCEKTGNLHEILQENAFGLGESDAPALLGNIVSATASMFAFLEERRAAACPLLPGQLAARGTNGSDALL